MILMNIPCRSEQPPIQEFMSYLKHTYDVDSTFDSRGNWSFEGPEANIFNLQSSFSVDFMKNKTQLTVINNQKMANLFQTVLYKQKIKEVKEKAVSVK